VRTGVGGEEDLAAGEVLAEARSDRIDPAVLDAQRSGGSSAAVPGLRDGGVGVALRRGRREGCDEQHGSHRRDDDDACAPDRPA
jgi:hypothetical protein